MNLIDKITLGLILTLSKYTEGITIAISKWPMVKNGKKR